MKRRSPITNPPLRWGSRADHSKPGPLFSVIIRSLTFVLIPALVGCVGGRASLGQPQALPPQQSAPTTESRTVALASALEQAAALAPDLKAAAKSKDWQGLVSGLLKGVTLAKQVSVSARGTTTAPTGNHFGTGFSSSESGDSIPVLQYDDPADFYRGAAASPIEYSSREVNCSVQVYPFQLHSGNIQAAFQQTMLRERIDPRYREGQLATAPAVSTSAAPGADAVLLARFQETLAGLPNERLRIVIVASGRAAIIDINANSAYSWQKATPALDAMLASLRVEKKPAPSSMTQGPRPGGGSLAGLYRGSKSKYVVNLLRPVGYGDHVLSLHYYLFSADGYVYRCYDLPPGPDGDWRRFDFDAARRADPVNTGRYIVSGNQLHIQMGGQSSERIVAALNDPNILEIETINYMRNN
jgi:hypothetical protein